jgi:hypothetical protein
MAKPRGKAGDTRVRKIVRRLVAQWRKDRARTLAEVRKADEYTSGSKRRPRSLTGPTYSATSGGIGAIKSS